MPGKTTLIRRQLGHRLRRLREESGRTHADVELALRFSRSKMSRIEGGTTAVSPGDVWQLCTLYVTSTEVLNNLTALAKASRGDDWWEEFRELVLDPRGLYLGLEATADVIKTFTGELFHPLLRTPEYHRAATESEAAHSQLELARGEELRRQRERSTLYRESPCRLSAVVSEAAVHRIVGSAEIMAGQLAHVAQLVADGIAEVRVIPYATGAHPGLLSGAFTLMEFRSPADPDVVHLESQLKSRYLENRDDLEAYRTVWATLHQQAVPFGALSGLIQ
jgi:hypothetical protein